MAGDGGRTWRTWQVVVAAAVGLLIGAAAGASGAGADRKALKEAEEKLATAEASNASLTLRVSDRDALDAALRSATSTTRPVTTTAPPSTTTTVPPTTTTAGPRTTFGDGSYRVGVDIAPGTYRATGGVSGNCYWARLSNFTGEDHIIANYLNPGPTTVTILASDAGFESRRCGTWSRV